MDQTYFKMFVDYEKHLKLLGAEGCGRVVFALFDYEHGIQPKLEGAELMCFSFIASQIDRDRESYQKRCQKNRENVQKRWESKNTSVYDCISENTKNTKDTKTKTMTKTKYKDNIDIAQHDPFFEKFWEAYPKHMGKEKARKAFAGLRVSESLLSEMLAALEVQKKLPQWQDKQFIPYPASWLNQRRWKDEVEEIPPEREDWRGGGPRL